MGEIVTRKYICDVCSKEVKSKEELTLENVPCYASGLYETSTQVEMCQKCSGMLRKVIWDNFAEIRDEFGMTINKKYSDDTDEEDDELSGIFY